MIKCTHEPVGRGMTHIAGFNCRYMRWTLAGRDHPVVTALTASRDLGMINKIGRYPGDVVMTGLAHIGGIKMGCRLA